MKQLMNAWGAVGVTGAVDILVMSVLIYGALAWMRTQRMRRLQRGVLMVLALYLGARFFALELTATSLEALLILVLLAATVLYGAEIRRLIERLFPFARATGGHAPSGAEAMAELLFDLGAERVGALVVMAGRDDVERVIVGGSPLDGLWSEPLVRSIFDASSIGHDGALVLRGDRVWRFACHLPLSTHREALGAHRGTRHAAALGMSEQTDALCIAVSEERGTVTVCEDGSLEVVPTRNALAVRLSRFDATHRAATRAAPSRRVHLPTALAALLLSALSWLVIVLGSRPTERIFEADVVVTAPSPDLRIQAVHPPQVTVRAVGAGRDVFLAQRSMVSVTVLGGTLTPGQNAVTLGSSEVALPRGLTLQSIEPKVVSISVVPR